MFRHQPGEFICKIFKQAEIIDSSEQLAELAVKILDQIHSGAARILAQVLVLELEFFSNKNQELWQMLTEQINGSPADRLEKVATCIHLLRSLRFRHRARRNL
jgi:hypothetical protein